MRIAGTNICIYIFLQLLQATSFPYLWAAMLKFYTRKYFMVKPMQFSRSEDFKSQRVTKFRSYEPFKLGQARPFALIRMRLVRTKNSHSERFFIGN